MRGRYDRMVNISSIAGIGTALPGNAFYAGTKAELAILTKRFAMELGCFHRHVECPAEVNICPPMAAIANAIERATGRRLTELPMSPPKALAAIEARGQK
jgi:NAD(P)-dependent dehydrogenase (short-subunit alcohol dehydrogenase family)